MPERIQLRRTKGWRKPAAAVVVARPSRWGNPYRGDDAAQRFDAELRACVADPWGASYPLPIRTIAETIGELRGQDLACWCNPGAPCHGDTLLELANNPLSCPLIERGDRAESWAVLSTDGRYRYAIGRRLAHQPNGLDRPAVWIGLNPSTADHTRDDPTIRQILRFSAAAGAAEVVVLNMFAYRATDPAQLGRVADPVGPANPLTWDHHLSDPAMVIAAWGAGFRRSHTHTITAAATRAQALSARCLGVTAGGHPRHPLYVPATTPLEAYQ